MKRRFQKKEPGIIPIASLFDIYKKKLQAPQSSVIEGFMEVVKEELGIEVQKQNCRYSVSSKTLSLHIPGPIKNEILLVKEDILNKLKNKMGEKNTPKNIL